MKRCKRRERCRKGKILVISVKGGKRQEDQEEEELSEGKRLVNSKKEGKKH